jgi:hypothetical protein
LVLNNWPTRVERKSESYRSEIGFRPGSSGIGERHATGTILDNVVVPELRVHVWAPRGSRSDNGAYLFRREQRL